MKNMFLILAAIVLIEIKLLLLAWVELKVDLRSVSNNFSNWLHVLMKHSLGPFLWSDKDIVFDDPF